jgi:hypothetical protein
MRAYIDVRGPHPWYIKGEIVIELHGFSRSITVKQAGICIRQQLTDTRLIDDVNSSEQKEN